MGGHRLDSVGAHSVEARATLSRTAASASGSTWPRCDAALGSLRPGLGQPGRLVAPAAQEPCCHLCSTSGHGRGREGAGCAGRSTSNCGRSMPFLVPRLPGAAPCKNSPRSILTHILTIVALPACSSRRTSHCSYPAELYPAETPVSKRKGRTSRVARDRGHDGGRGCRRHRTDLRPGVLSRSRARVVSL